MSDNWMLKLWYDLEHFLVKTFFFCEGFFTIMETGRRLSTWNVINVEAALQQLNCYENNETEEQVIQIYNTVRIKLHSKKFVKNEKHFHILSNWKSCEKHFIIFSILHSHVFNISSDVPRFCIRRVLLFCLSFLFWFIMHV